MQDEKQRQSAREASLQPRPARSALIPTGLGFVLFFAATMVVSFSRGPAPADDQRSSVEFNHRLHVQDLDLGCSECHRFYEEQTFSGLPTATTCGFCHEEAAGDSAAEARLVELLAEGESLQWRRRFRQPPHVFYSHSRHVAVAELDCPICHGAFGESETPPSRVRTLEMDDCVDCHRRQQVSTDCTACHR